jgi:tetratricopeptide (TPR) repeat protein
MKQACRWNHVLPIVLAACLAVNGCAHLSRRGTASQDVIIARQLSQQGMESMHQGELAEAEARFARAIEYCPSNATARYQLANCLWRRGAQREAIEQLTQAVESSGGEDVEMLVELGYMWANLGRLDQGAQLADRAIRLAPNNATAWQLAGDIQREREDWQAALASYQRSLTLDAGSPEVQLSVAEVYHQLDRPARVLGTLHRLEDQLPSSQQPERAIVLKSLALERLERYDEAVQSLVQARSQRGQLSSDAQMQLARAQVAAGRFGDAQLTISRALPQADAGQRDALQALLASMAEQRAGPPSKRR